MRTIVVLTSIWICLTPGVTAQESPGDDVLEARVWLDGGEEPVVQRGERVSAYFRTSRDAFTAIFRIDTDGRVSLLFPASPNDDGYVRGGRDQRVTFDRSPYWRVTDDPGVGYLFMVSSPEPLDFSVFSYDPVRGWDLSTVSTVVYEDPYVAIDEFVAAMIPNWDVVPYALDFVTYHVGETRSYPRFLCYDCHSFRSFPAWNPYASTCSTYQIVVYDDPYFYPAYRYSGTRVVYPRPIRDRPRYAVAVRGGSDSWAPIVRVREAPPRPTEFKERAAGAGGGSSQPARRGVMPSSARSGASERPPSARVRPARGQAGTRGASPSSAAPSRRAPSGRVEDRPTLRRRPSAGAGGSAARGARNDARRPDSGSAAERRSPPSAGSRPATDARRGARPSTRPSPSGGRPSRPSAGEQRPAPRASPSSRPAPGSRPATGSSGGRPAAGSRPSASPDRPRPAAGTRPSARPGGSRPAAGTRPSVRPGRSRPAAGTRPSARPGGSRPAAGTRPSARPGGSRPAAGARRGPGPGGG